MAATLRLLHPSSGKLQLRSDLHSLWTSREPLKSLLSSVVATPASEPFLVPWMKSDARFIVCLLSHCNDLDVNHSSILDASSHRVDTLHLLMKFCRTSLWPPSWFFSSYVRHTSTPEPLQQLLHFLEHFPRVWLHHHSCICNSADPSVKSALIPFGRADPFLPTPACLISSITVDLLAFILFLCFFSLPVIWVMQSLEVNLFCSLMELSAW